MANFDNDTGYKTSIPKGKADTADHHSSRSDLGTKQALR